MPAADVCPPIFLSLPRLHIKFWVTYENFHVDLNRGYLQITPPVTHSHSVGQEGIFVLGFFPVVDGCVTPSVSAHSFFLP